MEKAIATHSSTFVWINSMDRGAWWAIVHGVAKGSDTTEHTHTHTHTHVYIKQNHFAVHPKLTHCKSAVLQ